MEEVQIRSKYQEEENVEAEYFANLTRYCTVLYCTVLYCSVLYNTYLFREQQLKVLENKSWIKNIDFNKEPEFI